MALPTSGTIALSQVNTELGLGSTTNISMNQSNVRTLFGIPSGAIAMSNGYSKSSFDYTNMALVVGWGGPSSKFSFTTLTNVAGPNMGYRYSPAGWNNKTVGVVAGGDSGGTIVLTSTKYTYASDVAAAAATLPNTCSYGTSASNLTYGISLAGTTGGNSPFVFTSMLYTFANDTCANSTSVSVARSRGAGLSVATYGLACGGTSSDWGTLLSSTEKYTYSGATVAASTALGSARGEGVGFNNTTVGIIACGSDATSRTATTAKWTFATSTNVAGITLSTARGIGGCGASSPTKGATFATYDVSTKVVDVYTFSNDTSAAGTNLVNGGSDGDALSSNHGGF